MSIAVQGEITRQGPALPDNLTMKTAGLKTPCIVFFLLFFSNTPALLAGLEYQPRGDRHEGVKPKPVSGYDVELLSARADYEEAFETAPPRYKFQASWENISGQSVSAWFIVDRDGSNFAKLPEQAASCYCRLSWNPEGNVVVFSDKSDGGRGTDLFTFNLDTSAVKQITQTPEISEKFFRWSPDGKRIAFMANGLFVIDVDGANLKQLTAQSRPQVPSWSPDSKKIAFLMDSDIYVMDADGANKQNLTRNRAGYSLPSWSPDGSKLAFASDRHGNWEVYLMNPYGTDQVRITDTPETDEQKPVWSPWL